MDLALNNLQQLICHQNQNKQTKWEIELLRNLHVKFVYKIQL